ncbi:RhoGAP-domain-containing protein [Mycena sanguinolenta]|uniref:RhoGAP-domain-containing protein n=1 Tax=Mycena sanguinolenta TaxID=230812 RepID=A0A8H6ZGX8_9AGAR|nr:RhoGAP-domain-containing protein [Mycena sanguinolenta]
MAAEPTPSSVLSASPSSEPTSCASCAKPMSGKFVRALGTIFHLDCFTCPDCDVVVADKFFAVDGPDGPGRQIPLCERDYFQRLNLLCANPTCGMPVRTSYISACNKNYHINHFTCSLCPTLFGPNDSYYEHEGEVYCRAHYVEHCATRCAECGDAIMAQYIEVNRNENSDEFWHPECWTNRRNLNNQAPIAPMRPRL